MKAWHFVGNTLRDGRPIPPDGKWLVHEGELIMCESGLHASERVIDALVHAPGATICRVELDGNIYQDNDKIVASRRKILWRIDGEAVLRAFARWCALQVVHLWDTPDIVVRYLKSGDELIREAAWGATWEASWDTARDTARDAAWEVAWEAASSAAIDAAECVDWSVAKQEQNDKLRDMILEARNGKTEWVFDVPRESEEE